MSNDAQWIADIARAEAEKVITDRTIPAFPAYFFQKDWLLTYDWWADHNRQLENRIVALHQRIAELERPWWKRWFSR
jgi:hypothetical protein